VLLLLDHGVDVNAKDKAGITPLVSACEGRHVEVMRLLLERGAEADMWCGWQGHVLNAASSRGQFEAVRLLLQHKVDVNGTRNSKNWSALHYASLFGHLEVARLLLDHRAEVNSLSNDGSTPLWLALSNDHLEVVQLLLEHGADVHMRTSDSQSAFQYAKSLAKSHTKAAQVILEQGAEKE
jgi:ankyrin repeat protein